LFQNQAILLAKNQAKASWSKIAKAGKWFGGTLNIPRQNQKRTKINHPRVANNERENDCLA